MTWATFAGVVAVYCETCGRVVAWAHETAAGAAFARHVEDHRQRRAFQLAPPAWSAAPWSAAPSAFPQRPSVPSWVWLALAFLAGALAARLLGRVGEPPPRAPQEPEREGRGWP